MPYDVEHEIKLVQWFVAKVGEKQADGSYICTFGELFYDEEAEQIFESLVSFFSTFLLSLYSYVVGWILESSKTKRFIEV